MNSLLLRIVSLLLVPCLIADPAIAAVHPFLYLPSNVCADVSLFTQQAFIEDILTSLNPLRGSKERTAMVRAVDSRVLQMPMQVRRDNLDFKASTGGGSPMTGRLLDPLSQPLLPLEPVRELLDIVLHSDEPASKPPLAMPLSPTEGREGRSAGGTATRRPPDGTAGGGERDRNLPQGFNSIRHDSIRGARYDPLLGRQPRATQRGHHDIPTGGGGGGSPTLPELVAARAAALQQTVAEIKADPPPIPLNWTLAGELPPEELVEDPRQSLLNPSEEWRHFGGPSNLLAYWANQYDVRAAILLLIRDALNSQLYDPETLLERIRQLHILLLMGFNGTSIYRPPTFLSIFREDLSDQSLLIPVIAGLFNDEHRAKANAGPIALAIHRLLRDVDPNRGISLNVFTYDLSRLKVEFLGHGYANGFLFLYGNNSIVMNMVNAFLRLAGLSGIPHGTFHKDELPNLTRPGLRSLPDENTLWTESINKLSLLTNTSLELSWNTLPQSGFHKMFHAAIQIANPDIDFSRPLQRPTETRSGRPSNPLDGATEGRRSPFSSSLLRDREGRQALRDPFIETRFQRPGNYRSHYDAIQQANKNIDDLDRLRQVHPRSEKQGVRSPRGFVPPGPVMAMTALFITGIFISRTRAVLALGLSQDLSILTGMAAVGLAFYILRGPALQALTGVLSLQGKRLLGAA